MWKMGRSTQRTFGKWWGKGKIQTNQSADLLLLHRGWDDQCTALFLWTLTKPVRAQRTLRPIGLLSNLAVLQFVPITEKHIYDQNQVNMYVGVYKVRVK